MRLPMSSSAKKEPKKIDLSLLELGDLALLKKDDPFMYHSIPAVQSATLSLRNVNHAELLEDFWSDGARTPGGGGGGSGSSIVTKRTQLATEAHPSVAIEDLLRLTDEEIESSLRELDIRSG